MNVDNLRKFIVKSRGDANAYAVLVANFDFLMAERIKITQNNLRSLIGRPEKELDKESIIEAVKKINEIAKSQGVDFYINETWEAIEAFLKLSVMEDVAGEFTKQNN